MNKAISFTVPAILIKDEDKFILSCESLSVYSQASTEDKVVSDFATCIHMLLGKWEKNGELFDKLKSRGILSISEHQGTHKKAKLESPMYIPTFILGNNSKIQGELVTN